MSHRVAGLWQRAVWCKPGYRVTQNTSFWLTPSTAATEHGKSAFAGTGQTSRHGITAYLKLIYQLRSSLEVKLLAPCSECSRFDSQLIISWLNRGFPQYVQQNLIYCLKRIWKFHPVTYSKFIIQSFENDAKNEKCIGHEIKGTLKHFHYKDDEAENISETSENSATRRNIPEDGSSDVRCRENINYRLTNVCSFLGIHKAFP